MWGQAQCSGMQGSVKAAHLCRAVLGDGALRPVLDAQEGCAAAAQTRHVGAADGGAQPRHAGAAGGVASGLHAAPAVGGGSRAASAGRKSARASGKSGPDGPDGGGAGGAGAAGTGTHFDDVALAGGQPTDDRRIYLQRGLGQQGAEWAHWERGR